MILVNCYNTFLKFSMSSQKKRNYKLKGKRCPKVHPSCLRAAEPLKQLRQMNLEFVCE